MTCAWEPPWLASSFVRPSGRRVPCIQGAQPQGPSFKSAPHRGHSPRQSSRQRGAIGGSSNNISRNDRAQIQPPSIVKHHVVIALELVLLVRDYASCRSVRRRHQGSERRVARRVQAPHALEPGPCGQPTAYRYPRAVLFDTQLGSNRIRPVRDRQIEPMRVALQYDHASPGLEGRQIQNKSRHERQPSVRTPSEAQCITRLAPRPAWGPSGSRPDRSRISTGQRGHSEEQLDLALGARGAVRGVTELHLLDSAEDRSDRALGGLGRVGGADHFAQSSRPRPRARGTSASPGRTSCTRRARRRTGGLRARRRNSAHSSRWRRASRASAMRNPRSSTCARMRPIRLRATASGLTMNSVRSSAKVFSSDESGCPGRSRGCVEKLSDRCSGGSAGAASISLW